MLLKCISAQLRYISTPRIIRFHFQRNNYIIKDVLDAHTLKTEQCNNAIRSAHWPYCNLCCPIPVCHLLRKLKIKQNNFSYHFVDVGQARCKSKLKIVLSVFLLFRYRYRLTPVVTNVNICTHFDYWSLTQYLLFSQYMSFCEVITIFFFW